MEIWNCSFRIHSWDIEWEFHISSRPRIILYIFYKSETPSETSSPKEAFPEQSLEAHNKYRKMHRVPALTWAVDLANDAQEYAEKLARARTLQHASKSERKEAGENLAYFTGSFDSSGEKATSMWWVKFESESTNIRVARLSFNMKIAGSGICCHSCHVCCFHRQYLSLGPFICFVSVITAVMYICQTVGVLWPRCFGLKVHKNTPCSIYFRIIYARTELGSENANKCVSRPLRINRTGRLCRFAREVSKQLFDKMCLGYVVTNFMRVVSIKFAIALKHRQN